MRVRARARVRVWPEAPERAAAVSEKEDIGVSTLALVMLMTRSSIKARLAPSRELLPPSLLPLGSEGR